MFSVMNYLLPKQGIMAMHASANHAGGDPDGPARSSLVCPVLARRRLSADPKRVLIGDDEHGGAIAACSTRGRCYARLIG